MADDSTTKDDTEWWIWLAGGLIVFGLLSQMSANVSNFVASDEAPVVESDGFEFRNDGAVGGGDLAVVGDSQITDNSVQSEEVGFFQSIISATVLTIATFSIFETAPWYVTFAMITSILSLVVIIYSLLRTTWIMNDWNEEIGYSKDKDDERIVEYGPSSLAVTPDGITGDVMPALSTDDGDNMFYRPRNERWILIEELIKSENESDWRQAILEADIMLEELLSGIGYEGSTIAERLQSIERSDMRTLEDAWSAHKIRNRIAHEGGNFTLDRDLFLKTIAQFERVFNEYRFI